MPRFLSALFAPDHDEQGAYQVPVSTLDGEQAESGGPVFASFFHSPADADIGRPNHVEPEPQGAHDIAF